MEASILKEGSDVGGINSTVTNIWRWLWVEEKGVDMVLKVAQARSMLLHSLQ